MQKKTRNQRKRELLQTACMTFAVVLMSLMLCTILVRAWAAEEPVNGYEYIASIGGDSYGNLQD